MSDLCKFLGSGSVPCVRGPVGRLHIEAPGPQPPTLELRKPVMSPETATTKPSNL